MNILYESMLLHVLYKVLLLLCLIILSEIFQLQTIWNTNLFLRDVLLRRQIVIPVLIDHAFDKISGKLRLRRLLLNLLWKLGLVIQLLLNRGLLLVMTLLLCLHLNITYLRLNWLFNNLVRWRRWWLSDFILGDNLNPTLILLL